MMVDPLMVCMVTVVPLCDCKAPYVGGFTSESEGGNERTKYEKTATALMRAGLAGHRPSG
jgi:hypothetical protein